MKPIYISFLILTGLVARAQQPIPAPPQTGRLIVSGATLHIGDGKVLENASLVFENGKIISIGKSDTVSKASGQVIEAIGKHVYPGLIALNTALGLTEIEAARATNDFAEVGTVNPNVRAIVAYNTDSKITPTVRSNGILMAQIVPQGGMMSGQSSVVKLDGWNWEDAVYEMDEGIHLNWPSMVVTGYAGAESVDVQREKSEKQIQALNAFFKEAKAYCEMTSLEAKNLRFEAMREVFKGKRKLYVHADFAKEILSALATAKEFGFKMVIVGASDAPLVLRELKEANVPVVLNKMHSLPSREASDVDMPYKTPFLLQQAGIAFAISVEGFWQVRNLPFNAGTASAYGLTKEEALKAISLSPATILGVEKTTGSLEVGKDATFIISNGDILDMRTNKVEQAYIQGRQIQLTSIQNELYQKYLNKYNLVK